VLQATDEAACASEGMDLMAEIASALIKPADTELLFNSTAHLMQKGPKTIRK